MQNISLGKKNINFTFKTFKFLL